MARAVSLTTLLDYVRKRADIESETARFPDAELTAYINQSITELYDLLVMADEEYYMITQTFNTTPGSISQSLASGFYKVKGVDVDLGGGRILTLRPYMFAERNRYANGTAWSDLIEGPMYRINLDKIFFIPTPTGAYAVTVWYIPTPTALVSGGDTFDGVNGWEELVVTDVAIKVGIKNQIDAADMQVLMQRKSELMGRIEAMKDRDHGSPQRVQDVLTIQDPFLRRAGWL